MPLIRLFYHNFDVTLFLHFPGSQCQDGWRNYKNGCYKLVTPEDPWNLVTWSDAKKKCNTIFTGTQSANIKPHLLYIETMDELVIINTERSIIVWFCRHDNS